MTLPYVIMASMKSKNKYTQELIQVDSHQALNTKGEKIDKYN